MRGLAAAYRSHHFDCIAVSDDGVCVLFFLQDLRVNGNCNSSAQEAKVVQEIIYRHRLFQLDILDINDDIDH